MFRNEAEAIQYVESELQKTGLRFEKQQELSWSIEPEKDGWLTYDYRLCLAGDLRVFYLLHDNSDAGPLRFYSSAEIILADAFVLRSLSQTVLEIIKRYGKNVYGLT
jgi:hypothetical protein